LKSYILFNLSISPLKEYYDLAKEEAYILNIKDILNIKIFKMK
jgi:hypothetical protein